MNEQLLESKVKYNGDESMEIPVHVVNKRKNSEGKSLNQAVRELVEQERFWATAAHALGPLMVGLMFLTEASGFMLTCLMLMVTGGIYLYYRGSSEFVSYHARQAFALQFVGTVGWIALLISGTAVWVVLLIISVVLILLLVGLLLTPLVIVAYPFFILASFLMPLSVIVLGTIGAWETWHGRDYRYPYFTERLDRWLNKQKSEQPRELAIV